MLAYPAHAAGDIERAIEVTEAALEIEKRSLPADHIDFASTYNNLGFLYNAAGKPLEARDYLAKGLEIRRRVLGPDASEVAISHNNLAQAEVDAGKGRSAEKSAREAIRIWRSILGEDHPTSAYACNNLGAALLIQGHPEMAADAFAEALRLRKDFPARSKLVPWDGLGWSQVAMGHAEKAIATFGKITEAVENTAPAQDKKLLCSAFLGLGCAAKISGREKDAKDLWQSAWECSEPHGVGKGAGSVSTRLAAKIYLGLHDQIDEEVRLMRESGLRYKFPIRLYCAETQAPVCEKVRFLLPES